MSIPCADPVPGPLSADMIAAAAVHALHAEARLTPKPGLVDRGGSDRTTHPDMNLRLLTASAEALRDPLRQCAAAARELPVGRALRIRIGIIGRSGERRMLAATGGVNTHRGALWAIGLLAAGAAVSRSVRSATAFAAALAAIPDIGAPVGVSLSHGQRAGRVYGVGGAAGEARAGFPHVTRHGLPTLRACLRRTGDPDVAALDALLAIMAELDDTCVLHRGGHAGLQFVKRRAAQVLHAGGCAEPGGRRLLERFCREADQRGLSMGGSADLLAATLFLDSLPLTEGR